MIRLGKVKLGLISLHFFEDFSFSLFKISIRKENRQNRRKLDAPIEDERSIIFRSFFFLII